MGETYVEILVAEYILPQVLNLIPPLEADALRHLKGSVEAFLCNVVWKCISGVGPVALILRLVGCAGEGNDGIAENSHCPAARERVLQLDCTDLRPNC